MTIDQITLFIEQCRLIDNRRLRTDVLAATAGARYEKNDLDKLYRQLEEQ